MLAIDAVYKFLSPGKPKNGEMGTRDLDFILGDLAVQQAFQVIYHRFQSLA